MRQKKIQKKVKTFRKRPRRIGRIQKMKSAETIKKVERRFQIVELRKNGYTIQQIADELGISAATASNDLRDVLDETINKTSETVEESRQLQLLRLDQLLKTYTSYATDKHLEVRIHPVSGKEVIVEVPPNPKYAELILQVEARRAKLLALDVPEIKKIEATGIREYIGVDISQI